MKTKSVNVARLLLLCLMVTAAVLRFVKVAESPPGFYIDEAAISAQVICVQQSGENLQGRAWPLLTPVLGGGYLTPTYLYPAVLWTFVFGDSIASFRSFAAFFSFLFIVGTFLFAKRFWQSGEAAMLCAVSAAISPWVFQFARIAWDPSLAPAYMVWAFALLWSRRSWEIALSGVFFALAAYCYPPLRVTLAMMMPFAILLLGLQRKNWRPLFASIALAALVSLPLLKLTWSGEVQGRFQMLSVFNEAYLKQTYGEASTLNGLRAIAENFTRLLSPRYLFISGDANLRHSTGSFGVWSWFDMLGVYVAVVAAALIAVKRSKLKPSRSRVAFVVVGYLAALLPAALTWESNPHALRSFGAVVFLVLGVGGALFLMWRQSRSMRAAVVGIAFVSFLSFVHVYFTEYPARAHVWFDTPVTDIAHELTQSGRLRELPDVLRARGIDYDPMAIAYYELAEGEIRCPLKTRSGTN